jgi:pyridoxamine 5'-phosphate oxidase
MDFKDCIDFSSKVKNCSMATTDGDQPMVRMMGLWFADESGFYFQAWTFKEVYKNLKENPKIEVCFYTENKESPYTMMRLRGKVEFIEDITLRERVFRDRPFLKGLGAKGHDDPRLTIFRLSHGEASFWPLKKEGEYPGIERVKF